MKSFLWRTFLSGLFVVLPAAIIAFVLVRIADWIRSILESVAAALPYSGSFQGHWAIAWAVVVLFLLCLAVGLALNLRAVRTLIASVNKSLTKRLPLYGRIRGFEASYLEGTGQKHVQAALVELDETLAPAFVVEVLPDGRYVIFVPTIPSTREGSICIMTPERVHLVDASALQVAHCIHHWGVGTGDLLKTMRKT